MGKINKIWGLEEMEKRVDNLRKLKDIGNSVDIYLRYYMSKTDNRLDGLYLTYHHMRGLALKYDRKIFGKLNDVEYKPKEINNKIWNGYINYSNSIYGNYTPEYISSTTVTRISPTSVTYSNEDMVSYISNYMNSIGLVNTVEE